MATTMKNSPITIALCFFISIASAQTAHEPGIYIQNGTTLDQIKSSVASKGKPAGLLKNAGTLGFGGVDIKVIVEGPKSERRITSTTPTFVFYGDDYKPEEYTLVLLESKDDRREVKTGKVGLMGRTKFAVDKGKVIKVKATKADDGGSLLSVEKPLAPGEYAFLLEIPAPERIWSFGVD